MRLSILVFAVAMAVMPTLARAEWPEKPVTVIVPTKAGGGFDSYVRAIAPQLEAELGVDVIVKNITGAAGQKGALSVYRAAPDGYTIGIFNMPGLIVPYLQGSANGYDISQVTWVANLALSPLGVGVKADSPYNSLADLCGLEEPFSHSDTGIGSSSWMIAKISMRIIDCDYRVVTGYNGSVESIVAVMRGDVDATIKPLGTLAKFKESGEIKILTSLEDARSLPDVPAASELGLDALTKFGNLRLIGAPPGLPDHIREKLSDAIVAAAKSEEAQGWAKSSDRKLDPVGWQRAAEIVSEQIAAFTAYRDIFDN